MRSEIEQLNRLVVALLRNEPSSSQMVQEALDNLGEARTVELLSAALRANRPEARRMAAQALGKLGYEGAIPAMRAALRDEHATVRAAAEEAMQRMASFASQAREQRPSDRSAPDQFRP